MSLTIPRNALEKPNRISCLVSPSRISLFVIDRMSTVDLLLSYEYWRPTSGGSDLGAISLILLRPRFCIQCLSELSGCNFRDYSPHSFCVWMPLRLLPILPAYRCCALWLYICCSIGVAHSWLDFMVSAAISSFPTDFLLPIFRIALAISLRCIFRPLAALTLLRCLLARAYCFILELSRLVLRGLWMSQFPPLSSWRVHIYFGAHVIAQFPLVRVKCFVIYFFIVWRLRCVSLRLLHWVSFSTIFQRRLVLLGLLSSLTFPHYSRVTLLLTFSDFLRDSFDVSIRPITTYQV